MESPSFIATVEEFNPEKNVWSNVAETITLRKHTSAVAAKGKCYVFGGQNAAFGTSGPAVSTVEMFDPQTNRWSTLAQMPTARYSAASAVVGNKIYVVGGYDGGPLDTVEAYDFVDNSWETRASMPSPRAFLQASAVAGKV